MTDEAIEAAFKAAQEKWLTTNLRKSLIEGVDYYTKHQRYFFFAGSEFGLQAGREIYNETHRVGPTDEDYLRR